jgi:hypothetical protein
MARASEAIADILANLPVGRLTNGWYIPPPAMGTYGSNYEVCAFVTRTGTTANTPVEAVYFLGQLDGQDRPFTGTKRYTLR